MNAHIELNLAVILFLPWYLILGALYWIYPRVPRNTARRLYDAGSLLLAILASVLATQWGFLNADPVWGGMWKQVLATAMSYGLFLAVLTSAFLIRARWLKSIPIVLVSNVPVAASGASTLP